ncbi:MAG: VWA domain-containing protein, partial [Thermoplasmatales archaeon]|nr:VWA domain-containing protein [Thermoplasmatales archaeon]
MKNKLLRNRRSYSKILGVSIIALFMLMTAVSAVVFFATPVEAQEPGVTKWIRTPDLSPNGLDVDATAPINPQILADDFICEMTGPITDIHIWGSWLYDYLPGGEYPMGDPSAVTFTLSIHADIPDPDGEGPDYSMPADPPLWMRTFGPGEFFVELFAEGLTEGYYNPCTCEYIPFADTICWKYDFYIDPCEAFIQEECNIYWLNVQAQPMDPEARFGWKTSVDHWNDDAVYAVGIEGDHDPWFELIYPPTHQLEGLSIDLAFELTTTTCEDTTPPIITKTHPEEGYLYDADAERGVDVLFVFDLSGSMIPYLDAIKGSATDMMNSIRAQIPDSAFGVVTFVDYNGYYDCCGYDNDYGGGADYPYALNASITTNTASISTIISDMIIYWGGDWPQDYSRVLYESLHDLNINWRTCRERVVVVFGDAP